MCGHTTIDKIRNYELRERLGIVPLSEKLHENRLGWFEHVKRKIADTPVGMVEILIVEGKQSWVNPKESERSK